MIAGILIRFGDDPCGGVGDTEVQHLPARHQVVQPLHHFIHGGRVVPYYVIRREGERISIIMPPLPSPSPSTIPLTTPLSFSSCTYTSEHRGDRCRMFGASSDSPPQTRACSSWNSHSSSLESHQDSAIQKKNIKIKY